MRYIEFGIGNKWLIRTETELNDGTEFEVRGIVRPIQFQSAYIRIWIRKTVLIIDLKQGLKVTKKNRNEFKIIFGIVSL
ncbi:DUF3977 family protein [Paenibacillus woosongensis]|uniref:DUF3977 family protein n=1 Tax=Paenibacillus woosongensis TaxID=307580 RepID=A0AA95IB35_9BACL|nr:DUF3977 family protein [Paenibacillus woosongensis]WHX51442.1 DUF3977 family protein [Paenibacillus woosongensis]